MKKSLTKKAKKVIENGVEELKQMPPLAEITKIGARMMLQAALEEEVTLHLKRDYYERSETAQGSRSGSKPRTVKTGSGDIEIQMPQVKNAGGPFHSEILPPRTTRMEEIQEAIPLLYMHGLSTRRVKKAVGKLIGQKGLSHQNIIRITDKVVGEFTTWKRRDLSGLKVTYLVLDGTRLAVRAGTKEKEAVLVAWGFLEDGTLELLNVSLGSQESYNAWKNFLEDMAGRGLTEPMLTVIDGCPGLVKAAGEIFPDSEIQRCTKHRTENILDKVLKADKDKVHKSLKKIFYASSIEHAREAVEMFRKAWGSKYPTATECLMTDVESCLTYYKYPYQHWKRIRTTYVIERSFKEVKRRTRGIRFNNEMRALAMVYWQLKELRWYGVNMSAATRAILLRIKSLKIQRIAA